MADSSTSSLTSTSHTLTATAPPGSMASGAMPSLGDIASALAFRDAIRPPHREAFLTPTPALPTASTQFAQVALSTFAGQLSDEQQERLRQLHVAAVARKKRKRTNNKPASGPADDPADSGKVDNAAVVGPVGPVLKIRRVHVDGFEIPQIWQQSNRILAASIQQAKAVLERLDEEDEEEEKKAEAEEEEEDQDDSDAELENGVVASSDSDEEDASDEDLALSDGEEIDDDDEEEEEEEEGDGEDDDEEEDEEADEDEDDDNDEDDGLDNQPRRKFVEDKDGLNDGFFDLDEFNKASQWFEAQDARADPNTDAASEDEELDWHTDPFSASSLTGKSKKKQPKKGGKKKKGRGPFDDDDDDEEAEEDEDEEDGPPLFGDMDLDAPSGASDDEDVAGGLTDGLDTDLTANDIFYKDFFAPPAKKQKRTDRDRPGRPSAFQPDDEEVQRAMKDVRRDLFEQLSEDGASGDEDEDADADVDGDGGGAGGGSRRSTHERRQAKILAEIRRLEAEALKEKKWAMAGEASAAARPMNSLLEEDLDFEHIGKPVPVITQEVSEDIEALVKRRILEQSFDEVRRRYGTGFGDDAAAATRRGLADIAIDDQPGKKSLATLYEEEHQQAAHPDAYVSQSDERLRADEREVERMWLEVSAQLDALSNWHYKPRPAAPTLSVVADVATVAMEDAQPATAQGVSGGARMLAPQEVYRPGTDKGQGSKGQGQGQGQDKDIIVVPKSGLPVARDEMSREEKKRRHRRNKERIRKSGSGILPGGSGANGPTAAAAAANGAAGPTAAAAAANGAAGGKAQASQQETLATLKKANVMVIGRKGELRDLEGNKPKAAQAVSSGTFKL